MARWNTIARGVAVGAAATLALGACAAEGSNSEALQMGTVLPLTGSLAFLGPPEIAGVDLAVAEINEAGGVLGHDVTVKHVDAADTQQANVAPTNAAGLVADGVTAIVGSASSAVTLNIIDDVVAAEVVLVSPASTSTQLSGASEFFYRTAPPDSVQGNALGNLILEDGHKDVGVLVFNDDYGTGLRDVVQQTIEAEGGSITYGTEGQEFDPAATNYSAEVEALMATDPDAVVVITFDQIKQILPSLEAAGLDFSTLYLVDGNTSDFSEDMDPGVMEGAQGTIPGAEPTEEFKERLNEVHGSTLESYAYGAESYDAAILMALAAVRSGGTDGPSIQSSMAAVSGANGGTECTGFAACAELLEDDEEIIYQAVSGVGPFNEKGDPSAAFVGAFLYDENNVPNWVSGVYGEVPTE